MSRATRRAKRRCRTCGEMFVPVNGTQVYCKLEHRPEEKARRRSGARIYNEWEFIDETRALAEAGGIIEQLVLRRMGEWNRPIGWPEVKS